jgi:uncharacterized protein
MIIKTDFPRSVQLPDDVWIPLSDGRRLSARIWLPEDARLDPVPAVLEYLPYRKSDGSLPLDAGQHAYFAGHGYAGVRVDIRGTGDSEGTLWDEYTTQEQDDAVEVIAWLAAQPWSNGNVGMIGISWGGFNGLQIAARRPAALKAVVSMCSTDDRYANDEHYVGGCVMGPEMQSYATMLLGYATHAPDPAVVGERWREMWRERLDAATPALPTWLAHQRRDDYWRHGSICEDYGAIECAVYMVGGWADGYRDAVLRMLEHYDGPIKALVGPWCHTRPHQGHPGPAIGFLQEAVRWWDHWLKGIDTGIMEEPAAVFWMQDAYTRGQEWNARTGRWLTGDTWPSPDIVTHVFPLGASGLAQQYVGLDGCPSESSAERSAIAFSSPQQTGAEGGCWISWSSETDSPGDQGPDDERSRVFDSAPLGECLEMLGQARAVLEIACDQPRALIAVRLCDVDAQGASTLVTRGVFNLTHSGDHTSSRPLVAGERRLIEVPLAAASYSFPGGHRLRLALATSQWPLAWPSPNPVTMTVYTGESRLELPVYSGRQTGPLPKFLDKTPEEAPLPGYEQLEEDTSEIVVERDPVTGRSRSVWDESGRFRLADGLVHDYRGRDTWSIVEGDPLSAEATSRWEFASERHDWRARVIARSRLTSDETDFHVTCSLDAYAGDEQVARRHWEETIPRDGC